MATAGADDSRRAGRAPIRVSFWTLNGVNRRCAAIKSFWWDT
jgi:hypothetical protein